MAAYTFSSIALPTLKSAVIKSIVVILPLFIFISFLLYVLNLTPLAVAACTISCNTVVKLNPSKCLLIISFSEKGVFLQFCATGYSKVDSGER